MNGLKYDLYLTAKGTRKIPVFKDCLNIYEGFSIPNVYFCTQTCC